MDESPPRIKPSAYRILINFVVTKEVNEKSTRLFRIPFELPCDIVFPCTDQRAGVQLDHAAQQSDAKMRRPLTASGRRVERPRQTLPKVDWVRA